MTKELKLILPTRDNTVGHWRFRDNLNDISGQDNHLTHNAGTLEYIDGVTEIGAKAAQLDGAANSMIILPANDADFRMGTLDFTGEAIFDSNKSGLMAILEHSNAGLGTDPHGWIFVVTGGQPSMALGDGSQAAWGVSVQASEIVNDGKLYYIAWVVNRTTGFVHIYIDGVESVNSPWAIPGGFGDLTPVPTQYFWVGDQFEGRYHEAVVTKEALTSAAIAERAAGWLQHYSAYSKGFLSRYLPAVHQDNDDLNEFMIPFETDYPQVRRETLEPHQLLTPDTCPESWLSHLAGELGFELIDRGYATETERRKLMQNIIWIYERKGMVDALEKIIEILGYTPTITEIYSADYPLIINQHRVFGLDGYLDSVFSSDFASGNLALWTSLNTSAWWRLNGGYLKGTGNGSDDATNGIVFNDTQAAYLYESSFTLETGDFDVGFEGGLYLRYQDTNNWLRLEVQYLTGPVLKLVLKKNVAGTPTETVLSTDADTLQQFGSPSPTRLWIYDDGLDNYTAGVETTTLAFDVSFSATGIARTKKGLWVNDSAEMIFGYARVHALHSELEAKLFKASFVERKLQISLSGTPQYNVNKKEYLKRVLPNYVPAGVVIEWL